MLGRRRRTGNPGSEGGAPLSSSGASSGARDFFLLAMKDLRGHRLDGTMGPWHPERGHHMENVAQPMGVYKLDSILFGQIQHLGCLRSIFWGKNGAQTHQHQGFSSRMVLLNLAVTGRVCHDSCTP